MTEWPLMHTRKSFTVGAIAGAAGLVAVAVGALIDPGRAAIAYVFAYSLVAAIAMGALILLLIGHAANARWPAPLRRVHESMTICFPILAVLFVPLALSLPYAYVWADPQAVFSAHDQHLLESKRAWLNPIAFVARAAVYLVILGIAAEVLRWRSRRRDVEPPADRERAVRADRMFAAGMLPPVGLAATFAGFDWVMSVEPTWYSSMFGIYYFAGGFAAGLAVLAITAMRARHVAAGAITPHHFHAIGRLLFAFVVFWTYAAFFQGFLIAIADRPTEVMFFLRRLRGGWEVVLWALLTLHFAVPFLLLLPRSLKMRPRYVATAGAIVLAGHILDLYWVVIPARDPSAVPSWLDLAALVGVAGTCVAFAAWRQRGVPIVAANDPYLEGGIRYASPT